MNFPLQVDWQFKSVLRWLVILGVIGAVVWYATRKQSLAAGIVAASKNNPAYSPEWKPVISDLAHRYEASLKVNRPDRESPRLANEALAQGCHDPFVRYVAFKHHAAIANLPDEKAAREGLSIIMELGADNYPSVLQAYAAIRGYDVWQRAFGLKREETDLKLLAGLTWQSTIRALSDRNVPEWMNRTLVETLEEAWWGSVFGRKFVAAQVDPGLTKHYGDCATLHYLTARRAMNEAWEVRGDISEHKITERERLKFQALLRPAKAEFERAWEMDPHHCDVAEAMIDLCTGLYLPREEMEKWFQRGLATGQDASTLVHNKRIYISSSWHGSFKEELAFTRECLAHPEWGSSMSLQLWAAHNAHYKGSDGVSLSYFAEPDVWADIKMSLHYYLELNPDESSYRLRYAYQAWLAHDWPVLTQQLALLDVTTVNLESIGGRLRYEQMIADAKNPPKRDPQIANSLPDSPSPKKSDRPKGVAF